MDSCTSVLGAVFTLVFAGQMMPSSSWGPLGKCQRNQKSCPPGHEVAVCDSPDEFQCQQCGPMLFQPNDNRIGDKCRWRKQCVKPFMKYLDHGSTVKDAKCACEVGFHFENEDQRACVPNRFCEKGFGQGPYGVCENCLEKMMFSDTRDQKSQCKPLRNCRKESRCTTKKSNGTFDNICGPKVRDVNDCSTIIGDGDGPSAITIAISVVGGVVGLLVILTLIFLCYKRRSTNRKYKETPLTEDQLAELQEHILHRCEKDEDLSKKVIAASFKQVESRIDRHSWALAQKLFKNHPITGKYEILVETYKDKSHKETVQGYLGEWRSWRGDNHVAVSELFQCLRDCKKEEIGYEVCNRLRNNGDVYFDVDSSGGASSTSNRAQKSFVCDLSDIFPCVRKPEKGGIDKGESPDTSSKLLEAQSSFDPQTAGTVYRQRPHPSAPVIEESNGLLSDQEVQFHRQYSQPVQATS